MPNDLEGVDWLSKERNKSTTLTSHRMTEEYGKSGTEDLETFDAARGDTGFQPPPLPVAILEGPSTVCRVSNNRVDFW